MAKEVINLIGYKGEYESHRYFIGCDNQWARSNRVIFEKSSTIIAS